MLVGAVRFPRVGGPAGPAVKCDRPRTLHRSNGTPMSRFGPGWWRNRPSPSPENTGIRIAPDSWLGISVAQFGSSAAGTMYLDTGGAFFRDETVFLSPRNHPETSGWISLGNKQGMAKMQYIFDLIWTQSCTRYLASMGQGEVEQ